MKATNHHDNKPLQLHSLVNRKQWPSSLSPPPSYSYSSFYTSQHKSTPTPQRKFSPSIAAPPETPPTVKERGPATKTQSTYLPKTPPFQTRPQHSLLQQIKSPSPLHACQVPNSITPSLSPQAPNSFASSSTLLTTLPFPAPTHPSPFYPTNLLSSTISTPLLTPTLKPPTVSSGNTWSTSTKVRGLSSPSLPRIQTLTLSSMESRCFPCQPIYITHQQMTQASRSSNVARCTALEPALLFRLSIESKPEDQKSRHKTTPVCSGIGLPKNLILSNTIQRMMIYQLTWMGK
ncbi:hypothetical protein V8G54_011829 [Vigna mungo]|uniref:Uncharacterized protein n=1 Tax=Vigna mungo TaxID=3915 RepID=A0AAQ3NRV8_VIGMU